jgi:hypothetical protein
MTTTDATTLEMTFDFSTLPVLAGPTIELPTPRTQRQERTHRRQGTARILGRPRTLVWLLFWVLTADLVPGTGINPCFKLAYACSFVMFVVHAQRMIERDRLLADLAELGRWMDANGRVPGGSV